MILHSLWARHCANLVRSIDLLSFHNSPAKQCDIPIFQMRKLRPREVETLAQVPTA